MTTPTILGGGGSILSTANSLLENGRNISARNGGTGMSASSRQLLEGFYNNGPALFNQLYAKTENAELNNQIQILALRSQNRSLVAEGMFNDSSTLKAEGRTEGDNGAAAASTTTGTAVDTTA